MIRDERALLAALLRLLLVVAALLAAAVWWSAERAPDYRSGSRLRLAPAASAAPAHPVSLDGESRHAWELGADGSLRFPLRVPGGSPALRFAAAGLAGDPQLIVRLLHEDGRHEEVWSGEAPALAWGQQLVELPLAAGEASDVEFDVEDGVVALADVVLLSDGQPVDESEIPVRTRQVALDLLVDHGALLVSAPADPEREALGLPGPKCVPLDRGMVRWFDLGSVPAVAALELVVHAAPALPGVEASPGRMTVVAAEGARLAELDLGFALRSPRPGAPAPDEVLLTIDLADRAGQELEVGVQLEGAENLFVGLREALLSHERAVPRQRVHDESQHVLLVVVDGLRPDRLGSSGHPGARTPALDALAARGGRWERALAPSSWALPSLASLLTGVGPLTHGLGLAPGRLLSRRIVTVAQSATWAGVSTAAFGSDDALSAATGLDRGYERSVTLPLPATGLVEPALDWIDEHAGFTWFLTLHLTDPGQPRELDGEERAAATADLSLVERLRQLDSRPGLAEALAAEIGPPYDAAVAEVDRALGALLQGLGDRSLLERTLVVVVGSHGLELSEHGGRLAGQTLFDEVLRVPLVVAGPALRGAPFVEPRVVELVDVTCLLGQLGGLISGAALQGRVPLPVGAIDSGEPPLDSTLFPFEGLTYRRLDALRQGSWLLLVEHGRGRALYDLALDPAAQHDLLPGEDEELSLQADTLESVLIEAQQSCLVLAPAWAVPAP